MAVSVWSVLSGFMWGLGSGVGFMLWVLVRLLNFQKKEMERRHAWLRWSSKHKRPVDIGSSPSAARTGTSEDEELQLLLHTVDHELAKRGCAKLTPDEIVTAIKVLEEHKDEGHPRVAILQVVFDIQLYRRRQSMDTDRPPDNGPEASSTTSIGSTVA